MLTLANHAEAINGLLYLMGAGWNVIHQAVPAGQSAIPMHFGVGVTVLVPWGETNLPHQLRLWLEPEDGGDPVLQAEGAIEVGRPAGAPRGSDQRAVLAVNANVAFPHPGGYRLLAEIGSHRKSVSFQVIHDPIVAASGAA